MPSLLKQSDSVLILNSENANKLTHELILKNSMQVSIAMRECGKPHVYAFLIKLINELGNCANNDWTIETKKMYAESLMNLHWDIRMDDFVGAFRAGIKGGYGKVYGKIDLLTINSWINNWIESKEEYIATKKSTSLGWQEIDPAILGAFKTVEEKKREPIAKSNNHIGQQLLKEFDALYFKQPGNHNLQIRFVDYSGEKLDIDGYILKRIEEINQQTTTL